MMMANDSGFVAGVLFGEHRSSRKDEGIKPGVLEALRSENMSLREQNQQNREAAAGSSNLAKALIAALHEVAPDHPLVNPVESGTNALRNKIFDEGARRVLNEDSPGGHG